MTRTLPAPNGLAPLTLGRKALSCGWPALVDDRGAATAEYAIATMAAVGFAGLLVLILRSEEVRGLLAGIVRQALSIP